MDKDSSVQIRRFGAEEAAARLSELGEVLHACVLAGASVGFVLPCERAEAEAFWSGKVIPALRKGGLLLLVAELDQRIVGTVQLDFDTMPNQSHRAEVRKLLVHPDVRRRGVARSLMAELERRALALGRRLLTLDTRTGDSAELLYALLGYSKAGIIPAYCRDTIENRLDPTTIMYKTI